MAGVPYTFGNATTTLALSQLDSNFATNVTIGSSQVGLGNSISGLTALTGGVDFGAQTLTTYANGTWTPGISFGGGTTGITYSIQTGHYIKIGKLVLVNCGIILTSKGSSTGAAKVTGLPYTTATGADQYAFLAPLAPINLTLTALTPLIGTYQTGTAATLDVLSQSSTNGAVAVVSDTAFANNSQLFFSLSYIATAE